MFRKAPLWQAQHPETTAASISGFFYSYLIIKYPPSSNVKGKLTVLRTVVSFNFCLLQCLTAPLIYLCPLSNGWEAGPTC